MRNPCRCPSSSWILRVPNAQKGQVIDAMALNLDLPSTPFWITREPPFRTVSGAKSAPLGPWRRSRYWRSETFHEHFAVRNRIPAFEGVRTPQFKYVRYVDHGSHEFLHDLRNDPDELINLAHDPSHRDMLTSLVAEPMNVWPNSEELSSPEGRFSGIHSPPSRSDGSCYPSSGRQWLCVSSWPKRAGPMGRGSNALVGSGWRADGEG